MASNLPGAPDRDQPFASPPDPRRRLLEETLGAQYEIMRLLGQGGAGTVYLARERLLERLVAIKMLRSELVSADTRERFTREARTAAKLMHANIVPLYSFGHAGDTLFYIMGYVEGESLESMLTRVGRCDPDDARRILVEVADALGYAHRNGVVHRDVKPDNILIDRDSRRALLTDFGIAKSQSTQSTLTQTGHIVGTPLYMSPEQASGDSVIDGRSDIYSLGVIGYRMLSGRLPIEGTSAQDVMRRHVMQDPAPLAGVAPDAPADLAWVITRCLDKDPSRRWPTVEAFRQVLESGDASASELPEPLEHLSSRGVLAACVSWAMIVVAAIAWPRFGNTAWAAVGVGIAGLALAVVIPAYRNARAVDLTSSRLWALLGAPPERWSGWWPSSLRRSGDVWHRLPAAVRRYRAARTVALIGSTAIAVPVLAAFTSLGDLTGALYVIVAALGLTGGLLVAFRGTAARELSANGIQQRALRKWLSEPTWGSAFWRRSETVAHLAEPRPAAQPAIDSSSADPYCVITPTQSELPRGMFDHIDPRSPTPLYAQIASRLRVAIASGELRSGDGLPSVRQLSSQLRINPATVVQAYRELEVEGLVSTRQGAGTFVQEVAADKRTRDRQQEARRLVRELLAQAAGMGINSSDLRAAIDQELKSGAAR